MKNRGDYDTPYGCFVLCAKSQVCVDNYTHYVYNNAKGVFIVKSVKINITLRDDLLERADLYASNNAVTRSGLISLALSQYLDAMQKKPVVADAIGQMGVLLKLAVTGKTDSASMMPLLRR